MGSSDNRYNLKSPAVKRLMREAAELKDATYEYHAQPLDENLFEWHFTVRGPADSDFDGGVYHGRILLPPEYPMKPPSIILLTPNGRFEISRKICLSISGYHPESWQPSWSIRTALLAIIGFMPSPGQGAIGSLDYPSEERKRLAQKSHTWSCDICGNARNLLCSLPASNDVETALEAREIASLMSMKGETIGPTTSVIKTLETAQNEHQSETNTDFHSENNDDASLETSESTADQLRRRNVIHVPQPVIIAQPELITERARGRITDTVIWIIVAMILLLLFRRCFLLEGSNYETVS